MRSIRVSVPDDVLERAERRAAASGRALSSLLAEYVTTYAGPDEAEFKRLEALQERTGAEIKAQGFRGSDRLSRDELYDRGRR